MNLGTFDFSEASKEKLTTMTTLIGKDEQFLKKILTFISAKTFNDVLKDADKSIIDELKATAGNEELFLSTFRTKIDEAKLKEAYIANHNFYIDDFIQECGGSYSEEIIEQLKQLRL